MNVEQTAETTAEDKVRQVVALLDELLGLIGAENDRLNSGLPASLGQSLARKTQLSAELDASLAAMRRGELGHRGDLPPAFGSMVERLQTLRPMMSENTRLIRASMRASRRRIDAIMKALRAAQPVRGSYGADSRVVSGRTDHRGGQWA
jgi:hypothetical protein